MTQLSVFDIAEVQQANVEVREDWLPPEPPSLDGIDSIELDFETTGKRWWAGDMPIGAGVALPDGRTFYLPWGHRGGGNLDENVCRRWFEREVRNKRITNLSTKFEVHISRNWGIDLEAQGNVVSDVAHYAALLDDSRYQFSLDALVREFLPDEQKIHFVNGQKLDVTRMASYHASVIAVRAEADVRQAQKLKKIFWQRLTDEGLHTVRELEDHVIYAVAEMERNGTVIDVDLLDTMVREAQRELEKLLLSIYADTGLRVNPNSNGDMLKLFTHLKLPIQKNENGSPSFTDVIMKAEQHPTARKAFRAGKLMDLLSKYLIPYQKRVDRSTGILRYALHQLRAQKDDFADFDSAGTISGRFSSTQLDQHAEEDTDKGFNIQQVIKVAKQRVMFGFHEDDDTHDDEIYLIRRLHVPRDRSHFHLSADAMQIEYRLFAEKTQSPRLLKIYEENPAASFHKATHKMLLERKPDLTYRRNKDYNFANIYGAGLRKKALMLEFITKEQYTALNRTREWKNSPLLAQIKEIDKIYDEMLPEVKPLLERAGHLAMPKCNEYCRKNARSRALHQQYEHRGYVKTITGRRARFPEGDRTYSALNRVIQGSAADIMKQKLIELHKVRRQTGFTMRFTVHDEVDGDAPDLESATIVGKILNRQSFKLDVPILWEVGIGTDWGKEKLKMDPITYEWKAA
jgi:DNA polymerase I-like protein with 3'-5' exonuclease and polymerase domains